ncbi:MULTISPECIES: N-acetyltransferase [unclassified Streptomyces]|uniref:GNAT family N-acetyltransferase n=1 Tax=Streptomycetaceae TaxID=2062 RepID=UPI002E79FD88|nr:MULTISPECIES: N-acetyltransferase [unclassified Streptomyces]MED7950890.1 N-acetyltransferase [Streptomyces sp. BE303]MEE1826061.1 N-acetyltransferase [Streptomyces sp. BE20]
MKVSTRVECPEDAPATRRVHMAAFPGPDEADLVDALRRDPAWLPGLSVVAVDGSGLVVGHALLTRLRVGEGEGLALAPVAVAPEWQRKGVGELVVKAALTAAEEAGETLVVVLGDPEYYARFGFLPAQRHEVTGPFEVPDAYFQVLALSGYDGSPRGLCRYPEPFVAV